MRYRSPKAARRSLLAVARAQGGYVTAKQARLAGYRPQHLAYHVKAGNLNRVGHGLYRVPELPVDEHDDLIRLALWSRDRQDRPQAVVSHQSALALLDLSDVLPRKVHLTVPRCFRKPAPAGCTLHHAVLGSTERDEWTVFSVTRTMRTLCDVARSRGVSREQLELAVDQALERGLVRRATLRKAAAAGDNTRLLEILDRVSER